MRRLIFVMTAFFALIFFGTVSYAENDAELLKDYSTLEWKGSPLEYNSEHKTLGFPGDAEASACAYADFPVNGAAGLFFYADVGSYANECAGIITLSFLDESGNAADSSSVTAEADGSFRRYQLGSEIGFFPIPENTASVRVSLSRSSDGKGSPYFRSLSLTLSASSELCPESAAEWTASGKLELVQVRVTKSQYWIWVAIIVMVPLIFFGLRKTLDKAKKIG